MLFVEFEDLKTIKIKIKIKITQLNPEWGFCHFRAMCKGGMSGGSQNEEPQVNFDEFFLEEKICLNKSFP